MLNVYPGPHRTSLTLQFLWWQAKGLECFLFAFPLILWEVWDRLLGQMVLNLAETFVAIFLVTNIFLFHPGEWPCPLVMLEGEGGQSLVIGG